MRISDWSSDVCSSDLLAERRILSIAEPGDGEPHLVAGACNGLVAAGLAGHDPCERLNAVLDAQPGGRAANAGIELRHARGIGKIGRGSCRERVCQYV